MLEIIPVILTSDPAELVKMLDQAEKVVDRVQIDIVDGIFAQNTTVGLEDLAEIQTNLNLDIHLMVEEPINWLEKSIAAGADRLIGQVEMMSDQGEFIHQAREKKLLTGLALDLETPISEIEPTILPELDVVLVLSVEAGFGGQKFHPSSLTKIAKLDKMRKEKNLNFKICDDGGISFENIDDARRAGVDEVAIGRRLFQGDMAKNLARFQEAAKL